MKTDSAGILLGLFSGLLWGSMDAAAQFLLHNAKMGPEEFVSLTMAVSVFSLLFPLVLLHGLKAFSPFATLRDFCATAVFAFFILGAEVCFFSCVKLSNASSAAVLAATRPFWIMGILAAFASILPTWKQVLCGAMAVVGVLLLVTDGHISNLTHNWLPLVCGLGAAITSACYTVQSKGVIARNGSLPVLLCGMILGSLAANIYHPLWQTSVQWDFLTVFCVLWVSIVGHILAYCFYLMSAARINPSLTGLLETVEPLTATILSYLLFKSVFQTPMLVGGALILLSVTIISFTRDRKNKNG